MFCAQSQSEVPFLLPLGDACDHCRMDLEGDEKSPPCGAVLDPASSRGLTSFSVRGFLPPCPLGGPSAAS